MESKPTHLALPLDVAQKLHDYLIEQPYRDVAYLVEQMVKSPRVSLDTAPVAAPALVPVPGDS